MKHRIIVVFFGLILAGCSGVMIAPENGNGPQDGSGGNLTVRIGYSISSGRTAYPTHDGTTPLGYALEFTWAGGGGASPTHDPVSISPGIPASVRLETGSWTITAKAMAGAVEKASGSETVTIMESGNADVAIALSAVGGGPATGTLGYALYFPAGTTGSLSLENESGGTPAGSPATISDSEKEGAISLPPGSYLVKVSLSGGGETAGRTEAVHIVAGLTTKVAYNFYDDLASAKPVASDTDLAKIGVDPGWPLSGRYVLTRNITLNDWVPLGSAANPFAGSFDGGGNTIAINGFAATALEDNEYIGIFAAVKGIPENKARVKNLNIASSVSIAAMSATIGQGIGLASGYAEDAVLSGINFSGSLSIAGVTTIIFAGGAVGDMRKGAELRDCASAMSLSVAFVSGVRAPVAAPPYTGAGPAIGGLAGIFLASADGMEFGEDKDVLIKNCANSGDVTVSNRFLNVFNSVGGIAGGWEVSMNNDKTYPSPYMGRIEDCVYIGKLSGSNAGGIVGAISGNGGDAENDANTSRILRCRVAGSIGGSYVGGIVGTASGALVAQCSSDGTIAGSGGYVGGIAGRLERQARISDCWSDGFVKGGVVAGIGCIYLDGGAIQRCYSKAVVTTSGSLPWGIGGICMAYTDDSAVINVTHCVALNDDIFTHAVQLSGALRPRAKRVVGSLEGTILLAEMNYAPDFPMTGPISGWVYDPVRDGTILEDDPPEQGLYEVTLGWDFDKVWIMGNNGYPKLRGVDVGY
jgi:hypothetical protein